MKVSNFKNSNIFFTSIRKPQNQRGDLTYNLISLYETVGREVPLSHYYEAYAQLNMTPVEYRQALVNKGTVIALAKEQADLYGESMRDTKSEGTNYQDGTLNDMPAITWNIPNDRPWVSISTDLTTEEDLGRSIRHEGGHVLGGSTSAPARDECRTVAKYWEKDRAQLKPQVLETLNYFTDRNIVESALEPEKEISYGAKEVYGEMVAIKATGQGYLEGPEKKLFVKSFPRIAKIVEGDLRKQGIPIVE